MTATIVGMPSFVALDALKNGGNAASIGPFLRAERAGAPQHRYCIGKVSEPRPNRLRYCDRSGYGKKMIRGVTKTVQKNEMRGSAVMISRRLGVRKLALSASLVVVALLVSAPRMWAQTPVGTVGLANGNVTVVRAGKSIATAAGSALQVGDKLTTGPKSRMTINLTDGSRLELNESSTLVLTEYVLNPDGSRASAKLTLLGGLVRSLVHVGRGSAPNFEVHTPNAVASARGTMFDVAYQENQPPPAMP